VIKILLDLVDFRDEHPRVLEQVIDVLLEVRGSEAAPVFAQAFEQCRDDVVRALLYIRAVGRAGDPSYFDRIAEYPDYVRAHYPHAYTDALAAVIGAAGRLAQYDWLLEMGRRDLFSARPAWLRALGEVAKRQPQYREEIVAILRRYIRRRELGPTAPFKGSSGNLVRATHVGHPPGARLDEPESYDVPCHNTAVEVLCELGEEVEV
jgi:hypothetical protein